MRACLIFNPQAGTADRIKDFLLQLTGSHRCELRATSSDVSADQIARDAVDEHFDRIIVAGGDGTVSEAVNGIAPDFDAVELAVLPFGTGNDLARTLGLLPDQLGAACGHVFGSRVEAIDVMQVSDRDSTTYCINVANGGMGGRVAADVDDHDKHWWGPMAYWMTSVSRLADLDPFQVDVDYDDHSLSMETLGLAVANGRFVGGGFPIAPRALLNDGLLDLTVLPVLPMFELMNAGLNFTLGRDHRDDRVEHFTARRVKVRSNPAMPFSIDGESSSHHDVTFEVLPSALRVVVGDEAAGLTPVAGTGPFIS